MAAQWRGLRVTTLFLRELLLETEACGHVDAKAFDALCLHAVELQPTRNDSVLALLQQVSAVYATVSVAERAVELFGGFVLAPLLLRTAGSVRCTMPRRSPMQRQRSDKLSGSSNCKLWLRPAPTRARRREVGWDVRSAPMCRRRRAAAQCTIMSLPEQLWRA